MAGSCHAPHMGPSRGHLATSRLGPALRYLALPPASSEWFPLWIQTSCFLWRRQLRAAGFFQKVKVHLVSVSWQVRNIRKVLRKINKPFGLYPNFLSPVSGNWMQREYRDGTAPPLTDGCQCPVRGARGTSGGTCLSAGQPGLRSMLLGTTCPAGHRGVLAVVVLCGLRDGCGGCPLARPALCSARTLPVSGLPSLRAPLKPVGPSASLVGVFHTEPSVCSRSGPEKTTHPLPAPWIWCPTSNFNPLFF